MLSFAVQYDEPQPDYSVFREASFGHGIFDIKNRTHAHFSWHRNEDGYAVELIPIGFSTDTIIPQMIQNPQVPNSNV